MTAWMLAWRGAGREWRLPEVRTLMLAVALAIIALGAVTTLTTRVERALLANAAQLLGGDAGLAGPAAPPDALAALAAREGLAVARTAHFPTMAFAGDEAQMLDTLAVSTDWPLRGELRVRDAAGREHASTGPPPGELCLDGRALVALGVQPGERVEIGGQGLEVGCEILRQPDGGQFLALAPRALMNLADADALGLLAAGSRARHQLLVAGAEGAVRRWESAVRADLPEDATFVSPATLQERLRNAFGRAGAFLHLTALLAALLAAVAIALAARQYARRKTDDIAVLKALGMRRGEVRVLLGGTLGLLALPATIAGTAIAWGLAALAWRFAGDLAGQSTSLPLLPALAAAALCLALLAGVALPPLLRLAAMPPVSVFRREPPPRGWRARSLYLAPLAVAGALVWLLSPSLQLALILAASLAGVAALAAACAALLLQGATRMRSGHAALRLGLAALRRRRGLSVLQATAVALGLTAMLALGIIAPDLLEGWRRELPPDTPNWFALNIQPAQHDAFVAGAAGLGATRMNLMPLAVGKLTSVRGEPPRAADTRDNRDGGRDNEQIRLSWAAELPEGNRVVAGHWHGAAPARAEVSIDESWRDRYGLQVGDMLGFTVGAAAIEAEVTSIRAVDWNSFRVNFFLILDPAHADDLPWTWLASFHLPPDTGTGLAAVTRALPNVSLIDVDEVLDQIRDIIARISAAVRWVLVFSLLAGGLVLVAALAATQREREHEAALLRTLGARRGQLRLAAASEFALLGLVTATTAVIGAAAAGFGLGRRVFELQEYAPPFATLAVAGLVAAVLVLAAGLAGTRRVTRTPPVRLLRRA